MSALVLKTPHSVGRLTMRSEVVYSGFQAVNHNELNPLISASLVMLTMTNGWLTLESVSTSGLCVGG